MKEDGLKSLRFLMLISSLAPVFILLAIKGSNFTNENWNKCFFYTLIVIVFLSFAPLILRYFLAKDEIVNKRVTGDIIPCSQEYSGYILSIALPLCQNSVANLRELSFLVSLLVFIFMIFYMFNLYYLNILFYMLGYRLYKVIPSKSHSYVIITKKAKNELISQNIRTMRLTNSLFLERNN